MSGYTKLFGSILHSTVWHTPGHVRLVWITMLALADRDGVVEASVPGLAIAARVERPECEEALKLLLSPDVDSRTKDHEGRRIEAVDGGWRILNHAIYRERASVDEVREKNAKRQQAKRDREKARRENVTPDRHAPSREVTRVTQSHDIAEASPSAEAEAGGEAAPPFVTSVTAEEISPETPKSLFDAISIGWRVSYERVRKQTATTPSDTDVRELVRVVRANATRARRSEIELAVALLAAYWAEAWPRDHRNRASTKNLIGQADRLLADIMGPVATPSPEAGDDAFDPTVSEKTSTPFQNAVLEAWIDDGAPRPWLRLEAVRRELRS